MHVNADGDLPGYATTVVSGLYDVRGGSRALRARLHAIFEEVSDAIEAGARFVVLSDRDSGRDLAPIPSLLLTSAVHHHLIRAKTRTQVGLLVEAGDVREVHHVALLIGFGAAAVNPYLAMESAEVLARQGRLGDVAPAVAVRNLIKALGKGVLKVMSKMGISTVASYRGAQVFEAIGLSQALVDEFFTGTTSQLGGIGLDVVAAETARRHASAYPPDGVKPGAPPARRGRRVPVAARGRAAPVRPRDGVPPAARHAGAPVRRLPAVHEPGRRAERAAHDAARAAAAAGRRAACDPAGGGRADRVDHAPVLDRRHEPTARSARRRTRRSPSR
ncbi:hypothetical protein GCM10025868_03110 [Angustibacter aerolatus]|uniref:Glutamate synthase central-N domain-containing protein n=1 Tax=Angustibacter aerolatus TaxID=1162965 RepID=A0ABQ6JA46_9ACTN|nr:hypothetical protein GCM10025868_03110 [Angustibacter aerolatus]